MYRNKNKSLIEEEPLLNNKPMSKHVADPFFSVRE